MKPIYLSQVGISNFRTYGGDFSIDLPEEPGLTVIYGMNGLGKTAFFDAIEWALLGEIQRLSGERLRRPEGNPLTREGSPPGSHRVELSWGSGRKVTRTEQTAPVPAQIAELLKDPNWSPQIHDLAVYLRLTHFLPQSTRERFLERDSREQWSLLQGPAGVERLERLRKMLDDGKARKAFDRRIASLEKLQAEAIQRVSDWNKLLADYERWTNVATAAAAISPAELQRILEDLESSLPDKLSETGDRQPLQRLATLRTAFENRAALLHSRLRDLRQFETHIRRFTDLTLRVRAIQEVQANAQRELDEIQRLHIEAMEKVNATRVAIANLEENKAVANQYCTTALMVLETESRRLTAVELRARMEERITGVTNQLAELERHRAAHREQIDKYDAAINGMEMANQNLQALIEVEQELAAWTLTMREFDEREEEADTLTERKRGVLAKRISFEKDAAKMSEKIRELTDRLAREQGSVDDATRYLSGVIQHIHTDDTVCPVCAQTYPPGELLHKAQGSIERFSKRTASIIDELRKLQDESQKIHWGQSQCNSESAEIEALLNARAKQRENLEKQRSELLRRSGIVGATIETLPSFLKEREKTIRHQKNELGEMVNALRVTDELALAAQQYETVERTLRGDLQAAEAELTKAAEVLKACQAKLATAAGVITVAGGLDAVPEFRDERLREVAKLEVEVCDLQGQLKEHVKKVQSIAATGAERVAKREADEKLVAELKVEGARFIVDWHELALPGEPNESALQEARLGIEKKVSENERSLERIAKTLVGFEAWSRRTQLAALEQAMEDAIKKAGANSKDHCAAILQLQLNDQVEALGRARAAQARAEDVAKKMMDLSESFSASALEPLSARISAFNRLISPFPYEFKLTPHVTATRTRTEARVTMPSVNSNRSLERDPEWWLSEGQMSAMGLSVLLGASTVYRWSRWRALLLDDPLQHTDLIHAAAFGDVIRSLMSDEGFQVIVSTHNYDEADFLIRKCRRANLPVLKVELLGFGPSGVRYNSRDF